MIYILKTFNLVIKNGDQEVVRKRSWDFCTSLTFFCGETEKKRDAETPVPVEKTAQEEEKLAAKKQKEAEELAEFDEPENFDED